MSVNEKIISRIKSLIEVGKPISPAVYHYSLTYEHIGIIPGWITASSNAIQTAVSNSSNAYRQHSASINTRYRAATEKALGPKLLDIQECVGEMVSLLENLLLDIRDGMIVSIQEETRNETFDDFLDHAESYLKNGQKFSAVIAGVVFEDTIKRIARKNNVAVGRLDTTISELVKAGVLTETKAKTAKVAAHVRNKAAHAEWDEFDFADIKRTIEISRSLIETIA